MKKKIIYISIIIILIASSFAFYLYKTNNTHEKCPDDYAKTDTGMKEYKTDMDKWTNNFFDSHPGATLSDWSKARYQYWVTNDCAATIERYQEGLENKDPAKMELIQNTINQTINENTQ